MRQTYHISRCAALAFLLIVPDTGALVRFIRVHRPFQTYRRITRRSADDDSVISQSASSPTLLLLEERTNVRIDSSTTASNFVGGPPLSTKPDYGNIIGPLGPTVDNLFLAVFRHQLARHSGFSSEKSGYQGIVEIAAILNKRVSDRTEIQRRAQETLRALFPSWLPGQYAILFSRPFPAVRIYYLFITAYIGHRRLSFACLIVSVKRDARN
jgi:hypothetical protein